MKLDVHENLGKYEPIIEELVHFFQQRDIAPLEAYHICCLLEQVMANGIILSLQRQGIISANQNKKSDYHE